MIRLSEMKKDNPYFYDQISASFSNFVISRSEEIATTYPSFKLKIIPNANKFKVSKSMVEYLKSLTGIDVFDEEILHKYIPLIKNFEEATIEKFTNIKRS